MLEQLTDYRTQVRVTHIEQGVGCWHIQLADGTTLKTKLLIGADGANSFVREQAFIDLDVLDYKQAAISCAIKHLSLIIMLLGKSFYLLDLWHICRWLVLKKVKMATGSPLSGHYQMIMPMNIQL